jgi:hypothetical protein
MSIPRDPLDSQTPPRPGPDGPDDAALQLRPRAEAGDPETREDGPTLAGATMSADAPHALDPTAVTEIRDPALFPLPQPSLLPPRPRPSIPLTPEVLRAPTAYDAVRSRLQLLPPLRSGPTRRASSSPSCS